MFGRKKRRKEVFSRSQRHIFPNLDVARGPVVHEHVAEDVLLGVVDGYAFAQVVALADEGPELEFHVEMLARGESRGFGGCFCGGVEDCLAVGSADGGPGDDDGGGAAVVGDG